MERNTIEAVIFDLDGVITDTAHYHFLAWKQLADELDISIDAEFNELLKGVSRIESLELILRKDNRENEFTPSEKEKMAERKNILYRELLRDLSSKDVLPGISDLISKIKLEGLPIGIASVSKNAQTVLKALELEETFDYVVNASNIKRSKPDPEIFLTACENLGANPKKSIGIEDAAAGIGAILASGMFAVGVGETLHRAHFKVSTTDELQWELIKAAYRNSFES
ncbi:beta-phosphoglucomutase [Pseudalkalibacillus sp. A8]|uniref:beta-phosphoglucomutase n=1 Tax=Pseudalkalibacillus sp. A8 TaxID=3382641 RepID=UPI0038B5562F